MGAIRMQTLYQHHYCSCRVSRGLCPVAPALPLWSISIDAAPEQARHPTHTHMHVLHGSIQLIQLQGTPAPQSHTYTHLHLLQAMALVPVPKKRVGDGHGVVTPFSIFMEVESMGSASSCVGFMGSHIGQRRACRPAMHPWLRCP